MTENFEHEVEEATRLYESTIQHAATRTRDMIERYGTVGALSRLMISADLQTGFKVLRDAGQLDRTFEALVVRYRDRFGPDAVEAAQWRLDHPYELIEE